jgi:hypothetical protein
MEKKRLTVHVPRALADRIREVVESDQELTVTAVLGLAVERLVKQLEKKNGGPFPQRKGPLKKGRPFGSEHRSEEMETLTGYLEEGVLERLRNAIYGNPKMRLFPAVAEALELEISHLKQ